MKLKYEKDLARHKECPPANSTPCRMVGYRYVHSNHDDGRNYLPIAKLTPRRQLKQHTKCVSWALSMFCTEEQAKRNYAAYLIKYPNFAKSAGSHLAMGQIDEADGHATAPSSVGHFSLFESATVELRGKFSILCQLSPQ